jgi:hypothetical protein
LEAQEDQKEMLAKLDPIDTHAVIFYRDGGDKNKPAYETRCLKAALREGANVLKEILKVKNLRSKLAERVFVYPRLLYLDVNRVGVAEKPISVMTALGPRTSIKRYEYIDNMELTFRMKVLKDELITEDILRNILVYLQDGGIGADRSQGSGTFSLQSFARVKRPEWATPEPVAV